MTCNMYNINLDSVEKTIFKIKSVLPSLLVDRNGCWKHKVVTDTYPPVSVVFIGILW